MDQLYSRHGITFRYPTDWEITEEPGDESITITATSPESCYWCVTLFPDRPQPEHVLETAIAAFKNEYEQLDEYRSVEETEDGREYHAGRLEFLCMDLVAVGVLRAFRTGRFSVLVLYQAGDQELKEFQETLEAMSDGLVCDFGDDIVIG